MLFRSIGKRMSVAVVDKAASVSVDGIGSTCWHGDRAPRWIPGDDVGAWRSRAARVTKKVRDLVDAVTAEVRRDLVKEALELLERTGSFSED